MEQSKPQIQSAPDQARLPELDFLRSVAVLMVLGRHMRAAPPNTFMPVRLVSDYWNRCGWMGVDLFFVLSGFLVSGLLFREYRRFGQLEIARFLVRRGLKIYPAFYLLIAVSAVIFFVPAFSSLRWSQDIGWRNFLAEAFFVQNYLPGVWNHTWSLAVEEHFYLLLALAFAWRLRIASTDPFKGIGLATLAISAFVLILRIINLRVYGPNFEVTHLRLDSLLFGVWLSYLFTYRTAALAHFVQRRALLITVLSCSLLVPCTFLSIETSAFINSFGFTCIYLGFGGLLTVLLCDPRAKRLVRIPSVWLAPLGMYSYSIYLFHMPVRRGVLLILDRFAPGLPFLVRFALFVLTSLGVGIALSRMIEIPMLKVRDRLFPNRLSTPIQARQKLALAAAGGSPDAFTDGQARRQL